MDRRMDDVLRTALEEAVVFSRALRARIDRLRDATHRPAEALSGGAAMR